MSRPRAGKASAPVEGQMTSESALPPQARLLTPVQVAEALGLGTTKVYELMARGELESRRLGRARRVTVGALVEFIEGLPTEGRGSRASETSPK